MRAALFLFFCVFAAPVSAHPGHLAEVAGHGHWLGAAALGAAIAIGMLAGLKGRGKAPAEEPEGEEAEEEAA